MYAIVSSNVDFIHSTIHADPLTIPHTLHINNNRYVLPEKNCPKLLTGVELVSAFKSLYRRKKGEVTTIGLVGTPPPPPYSLHPQALVYGPILLPPPWHYSSPPPPLTLLYSHLYSPYPITILIPPALPFRLDTLMWVRVPRSTLYSSLRNVPSLPLLVELNISRYAL